MSSVEGLDVGDITLPSDFLSGLRLNLDFRYDGIFSIQLPTTPLSGSQPR